MSTASQKNVTAMRRGVLIAVLFGALLGGAVGALASDYVHTAKLWEHGLRAETQQGCCDAHPFLTSADGTCRYSSVRWLNHVRVAFSDIRSGIYCHNHRYSDAPFCNATAYVESTQTGLGYHQHPSHWPHC